MDSIEYLTEMLAILKEKGNESPHYLLGYLVASMEEKDLQRIVKELRNL